MQSTDIEEGGRPCGPAIVKSEQDCVALGATGNVRPPGLLLEQRVLQGNPLGSLHVMTDEALRELQTDSTT